jgi:hypothetical protein
MESHDFSEISVDQSSGGSLVLAPPVQDEKAADGQWQAADGRGAQ